MLKNTDLPDRVTDFNRWARWPRESIDIFPYRSMLSTDPQQQQEQELDTRALHSKMWFVTTKTQRVEEHKVTLKTYRQG